MNIQGERMVDDRDTNTEYENIISDFEYIHNFILAARAPNTEIDDALIKLEATLKAVTKIATKRRGFNIYPEKLSPEFMDKLRIMMENNILGKGE